MNNKDKENREEVERDADGLTPAELSGLRLAAAEMWTPCTPENDIRPKPFPGKKWLERKV
jgi:hypothetical protein